MELDTTVPQSAMVIFAHPDDPEFSCAGTIAAWTRAGCQATYVLLTSGNVGTNDESMTRERLAELREAEQRAACAAVGVSDVIFLHHDDCQLVPTLALRRELVELIRDRRPEVVICGDPTAMFWGNEYVNHPDHRAAATAAVDAVAPSASQVLLWPEAGPPHRVRALYISGAVEPNLAVDISDTLAAKIEALRAHHSQLGDWNDMDQRVREWTHEAGEPVSVAHAERFRRLVINAPRDEEKPPEAEEAEAEAALDEKGEKSEKDTKGAGQRAKKSKGKAAKEKAKGKAKKNGKSAKKVKKQGKG